MIKGLIIQFSSWQSPNATNTDSNFPSLPSVLKVNYKQEVGSSLYQQLPETAETQLAKELRGVYSQVRRLQPGEALAAAAAHVAACRTCDRELFSAGEVRRGREEGNGTQPVLAAPRDGGDAVRQARVRDTE